MTRYLLSDAVVGTAAERPDASDPLAGAKTVPTALYIESDTGAIKLSTGKGWVTVGQMTVGTLPTGVTSDGHTPGGIVVAGAVTAGQLSSVTPQYQEIRGNLNVVGLDADLQDGDATVSGTQQGTLTSDQGAPAVLIHRNITYNGHKMTGGYIQFDNSGSDAFNGDELVLDHLNFKLNNAGGISRFGHGSTPTVPSSITGALSAVTDAAAKDVLTSIIAALVADGGATNNTT